MSKAPPGRAGVLHGKVAEVQAERSEIIDMHKRGDISDAALRAVLHDLDLEEQRGE